MLSSRLTVAKCNCFLPAIKINYTIIGGVYGFKKEISGGDIEGSKGEHAWSRGPNSCAGPLYNPGP